VEPEHRLIPNLSDDWILDFKVRYQLEVLSRHNLPVDKVIELAINDDSKAPASASIF